MNAHLMSLEKRKEKEKISVYKALYKIPKPRDA